MTMKTKRGSSPLSDTWGFVVVPTGAGTGLMLQNASLTQWEIFFGVFGVLIVIFIVIGWRRA